MQAIELVNRLNELFKNDPHSKDAEIAIPIVDDEERKERSGQRLGKSGLAWEGIYAATTGRGKTDFVILWPHKELTHEPTKTAKLGME